MDGYLIRANFRPTTIVASSLIDMYSKCGSLEVAWVGGLRLLESITGGDGIFPDQEHNACLIDLLGEVRPSDKLMRQHENMRCKINEQIWNALIGVCRIHGNMNFGEQLLDLEPQSPAALYTSIKCIC
ncbi:hypothetical protein DKX38_006389 [Salix brachista]|uniref:Uncharacterized protein n=1 Tax=Salix brachista TaxID=2182728 RepID=A0A5N5N2E0_9ROSI|nr:hypothetical protein DKX38_006389 [Salix brachista]